LQKASSLVQESVLYSAQVKNHPIVTVVITTKNEEQNIENCLRSVKGQTFKNIELIVVDNFSEDKTVEIAQKYTTKVYFKGPERSSQRNYGAQVAWGEYVLYLDADMTLSPTVIEDCVEKCEIDRVGAIYIPERIVGEGFWIKVRDFERSFYTGTVIDAVRFIRRNLFLKVEGFDETLVGPEDWDFDRKVKKIANVSIINSVIFHNEGYFNMDRYLNKKKYYVLGIKKYVKKWGYNQTTKKQIGIWYRFIGVFIENGKWKRFFLHPNLFFPMYLLRIRVAFEYFNNNR